MLSPRLFAVCTLLTSVCASVCASVTTYPRPALYSASTDFSLTVGGTSVPTVKFYDGYDYAQLSMDEGKDTEYKITLSSGASISSYSISPKKLKIAATVSGSTLTFKVKKAYYLIVKINSLKEFVIVADPSETDKPASSGSGIFNVKDYNADNTGKTLNTGIQDALNAGKGHIVYVPPGIYLTGNIVIPDGTSLYLAGGSVLRFTGNPADYKNMYYKPGLGYGTWWISTAINSNNIKIYGRGTLDANGYGYQNGRNVSQALVPAGTQNFVADGLLIRESSFWTVVPTQSNNVYLNNLKMLNRIDMKQNDGIDVVESTNVFTTRAIAIAHDDSFSTKTWPEDDNDIFKAYPYPPRPLSNVTFTDLVSWTRCYSFKVGQGVYNYQQGITFQDGVTYTAAVGLGVDHKFGDGVARDLTWKNIEIEALAGENMPGVATWMAIFVEISGRGIGPIENSLVENIRIYDLGAKDAWIKGYNSSCKVVNTKLKNIYLNDNTTPTTDLKALKVVHMNTLNTTIE
ncbi:uncharacterized protein E0L32_000884 [Thyridium curvatum]|uniref:Uncharacterized protein n=1 Tax=Thyridium curvatum TaxID=1093900 RepID=A0A507AYW7_9PEZI|nr:uncharacterized protein E0L32_000884 [Thyridium curvatum]TPX12707.1 hypothetical protein E0L32_000884 [Thyridium curvatum]